jgi:hypothetical protein
LFDAGAGGTTGPSPKLKVGFAALERSIAIAVSRPLVVAAAALLARLFNGCISHHLMRSAPTVLRNPCVSGIARSIADYEIQV